MIIKKNLKNATKEEIKNYYLDIVDFLTLTQKPTFGKKVTDKLVCAVSGSGIDISLDNIDEYVIITPEKEFIFYDEFDLIENHEDGERLFIYDGNPKTGLIQLDIEEKEWDEGFYNVFQRKYIEELVIDRDMLYELDEE